MDRPRALRMTRTLQDPLPQPAVPAGYVIRPFRSGEEALWGRILESVGELGAWPVERIEKAFSPVQKRGIGRVSKESIHFALYGGEPVGTASAQLHSDHPDAAELSWIGVVPDHRRQGLGTAMALTVLAWMKDQGHARCVLRTNTARKPAIAAFLKLGFEPLRDDPKHDDDLWEKTLRSIGRADHEI